MFGLNSLRPALRTANTTTLFRSFSASARRDFARMTIVGRMGVQPDVTTTSTGREVVKYVVASSHGPRDNPQTSWFRISSFQPDGPGRKYLLNIPKGSLVLVEGDATMSSYENENGGKSNVLNVAQRHIQVLKRKEQDQYGQNQGNEGEFQ